MKRLLLTLLLLLAPAWCQAAIVLESTSTAAVGNGTTITTNAPSGVVSGNLLVLAYSTSIISAPTTPTGWTLVDIISDTTNNKTTTAFYWRVATGGADDTPTVTINSTKDYAAVIYRLSGVHATPVDTYATGMNATASTSRDIPAITTNYANSFLLAVLTTDAGDITGDPANWALRVTSDVSTHYFKTYTRTTTTAGAYGGDVGTMVSDESTAMTLAIRESATTSTYWKMQPIIVE